MTGVAEYNNQQIVEGLQQITLGEDFTSSSFAVDVAENWQSEYLQFFLYNIGTVWLVQQGSRESKAVDKQGNPTRNRRSPTVPAPTHRYGRVDADSSSACIPDPSASSWA